MNRTGSRRPRALALLLSVLLAGTTGPQTGPMHLHVSSREGDDKAGDGTADKPFRSLYRALKLLEQVPGRETEIHLDLGHYGKDSGEGFPIGLPAGVRLRGIGSRACELVGEAEKPVLLLPAAGAVAVEGIALRGGDTGVSARQCSAAVELRLVDVAVEEIATALDLSGPQVTLRADGLRIRAAQTGIKADGGAVRIDLARSLLEGCAVGLRAGPATETLALRDCRFEKNTEAGILRSGVVTEAQAGAPWRIEESAFDENQVGIELSIPGGDQPILVRRCQFTRNVQWGIFSAGGGTPMAEPSRVEDSLFRWNGIGLQLLSCGRPFELLRCRVEDNMGNGIFFGQFTGAKASLKLERSLFAGNGACGLFALTEVKEGMKVELLRCTVVDNCGNGVERKNRKAGSGTFDLTACILGGNAKDLERIEPAEVHGCLLEGGQLADQEGVLHGAAGFVDRAGRDYRPGPDSPARGLPLGAFDAEPGTGQR